ncbi:hypothetical protein [Microbacterium sp. 4-7]|uniref:hypothetical protein n=1 Tax=Microbacterium sp. 4-7 TaxID=1885327 RepID=UPI001650D26F|nr:hypothetical protein [Microbacterium sp. 4-7]MBC6496104.1 hypothetical protein [Microbacterium sp. 4-7]
MRITHPTPQPGRQHALGVDFRDGVATVDSLHPERELALRQHGFTIEADLEVEAPFQAGLGEPIIDLTSLTIPQLREIAEVEGVDLPAKALKAEIVEILSRQPAAPIADSTATPLGEHPVDGTPFFELTDEQLRDAALLEGLDIAPDASRNEIIGAFIAAGQESD